MNEGFKALNVTQFLGALNDNIFKLLCTFYLIAKAGDDSASEISSIVGIVFVIPFILFSSVGGYLADTFKKSLIIRYAKFLEVLCICLGAFAFYIDSPTLVYFSLFLKCTESAIYGPSKYSIIPEIVSESSISKANGYIDSFVYLAIILGSSIAPFLSLYFKEHYYLAILPSLVFSIIGYVYSLKINSKQQKSSNFSFSKLFPTSLVIKLYTLSKDKYLILAIIGVAYFSLIGAFVQINLIPYGMEVLSLTKEQSAWLFLLGAFGIGIGSLLAGHYSGNHIELGIVPIGATLIALGCLFLGLKPNLFFALISSLTFGVGAGLFLIPLNSFIQWKSNEDDRGEVVAAGSFLSWIGVTIASLLLFLLSSNLSSSENFLFISFVTTILSILAFYFLPDFCLRFCFILITRMIYRIRTFGIENVPNKGAAMLVPNHVSFVDALIISSTLQRRVRYVMWDKIYESNLILRSLLDFMGVIPISPGGSQESINKSFELCKNALRDGFMVCIFAEGKLSRDSGMAEFKKGFEKIAEGMNCPIIPVYLGGIWGSIFSHYKGRSIFTLPLRVPYPISVWYGKQMPNETRSEEVKIEVCKLSIKHYEELVESNKLKYENISFAKINSTNVPLIAIEDLLKAELNIIKPHIVIVLNKANKPIIALDKNFVFPEKVKEVLSSEILPKHWQAESIEIIALDSLPVTKDGKYVDRILLSSLS